jgi:hypothetical protein
LKTRDTRVAAGIDEDITARITINGTSFAPANLKAVFQSPVTAIDASQALRKQLSDGARGPGGQDRRREGHRSGQAHRHPLRAPYHGRGADVW